jgi:GNAT superfamily N-acetyltransferase
MLEASADIPGRDADYRPSFEEWRTNELERPVRRPELMLVALAGGEVAGFASLGAFGAEAHHGLTAVRRSWRRRGIATALKLAQIDAAKRAGFERIRTESVEANVPMRTLNTRLGYRPAPGSVIFRGPLAK